jgi:hypothetical protein
VHCARTASVAIQVRLGDDFGVGPREACLNRQPLRQSIVDVVSHAAIVWGILQRQAAVSASKRVYSCVSFGRRQASTSTTPSNHGQQHLRRVLTAYFAYYHRARTHLSLAEDGPEGRPIEPPELARVIPFPEVGGLHPRYVRRAAS